MTATIDIISEGRFDLGLGAGWNEMEDQAYGLQLGSIKDRLDRLEECLAVVTSLLANEETNFSGRFYQIENARCEPKGPQGLPPVVIGGKGKQRTLRMVAKYASGWDCMFTPLEEWKELKEILVGHCAEIGRDPEDISCMTHIRWSDTSDVNQLVDEAARLGEAGLDMVIWGMAPPTRHLASRPWSQRWRGSANEDVVPRHRGVFVQVRTTTAESNPIRRRSSGDVHSAVPRCRVLATGTGSVRARNEARGSSANLLVSCSAGPGLVSVERLLGGHFMSDEGKQRVWLPPRWVVRLAWSTHRGLYRFTGGRIGLWRPKPKKYGTLRLTTTGRRSGQERSVMLGYFEDGSNLVTMAMNGWADAEPAWWLNLQANPLATARLADGHQTVRGRAAEGEELSRLWARWREIDVKLDGYAALRSGETAVVILEPSSDPVP